MTRLKITDEIRKTVLDLYNSGASNADIMSATGIKSESTLYKVINELGIKGSKGSGLVRHVITLPADLEEWCMAKGDNLSQVVEQLIRDSISKPNLPYSQIEGGCDEKQNLPIAKSRVLSENAICDPKGTDGFLPYSETEPTNDDPVSMEFTFMNEASQISSWTVITFVDEALVKKQCIAMQHEEESLQDATHVDVTIDGQLIWQFSL